jgi:hypothetical protein
MDIVDLMDRYKVAGEGAGPDDPAVAAAAGG